MTTRSIVWFSQHNNAVVSLKDGFIVWRQSQKEGFLPIIYY